MKKLPKKNSIRGEQGFVLAISMIFLVVMTGLAVTAIRRATLDEKSAGNLRSQNLAFQAAEAALRFCEGIIELRGGRPDICKRKAGLTGNLSTVLIYGSDETPLFLAREADPSNPQANFPRQWDNQLNWTGPAPIATRLVAPDAMPNVVLQPQCMVEQWTFRHELGEATAHAYVVTARGVGATVNTVVWLQETIRCGSKD